MARKPIIAFPRARFHGAGKKVVTNADLELRTCPACKGTRKKTLAQVGNTFAKHSELAWRCTLCDGVGSIHCTEQTFKDLQGHYAAL